MANTAGISSTLKWVLVSLMATLVVLAAVMLYLMLDSRQEQTPQAAEIVVAPAVMADPIFIKIGPMTVNLKGDNFDQRLLYLGLSLMAADTQTSEIINKHMPQVQSRLLILLSGQQAEDLLSPAGKEQLSTQILKLFEEPFTESQPPLAISAVLFTDFILQ